MSTNAPTTPTPAPVCDAIARVLLAGWAAPGWRLDALSAADRASVVALYHGGARALAGHWWQHRAALLETATRLGIQPVSGGRYFAEVVAWRLEAR